MSTSHVSGEQGHEQNESEESEYQPGGGIVIERLERHAARKNDDHRCQRRKLVPFCWDEEKIALTDGSVLSAAAEPLFRLGPDVLRRFHAKPMGIRFQSHLIEVFKFSVFAVAALGRTVVKGTFEGIPAEVVPIRFGVDQMQVPGFIDIHGRGDLMASDSCQEKKTAVFLQDTDCVGLVPAVVPLQSIGKAQGNSRVIPRKITQRRPEVVGISQRDHGVAIADYS